LADTVARFPDRPVEVTLSPEELGRVRISLSTHDGALTMSVHADRPETLDLLRRNIDQLAQDFRDLGFRDLSFSFGDRPARQSPMQAAEDSGTESSSEAPSDPRPVRQPMRAALGADGGLDLRI
jgi:flagellar hook-length control protein FliK